MEKLNIKGAIFDLDGTLINSLIFWDNLYQGLRRDCFCERDFVIDPEINMKCRTTTEENIAKILHNTYGIGQNAEEILAYLKRLCYLHYKEIVELKEGVAELLEKLREKGVKICVATASERQYVDMVLTRHGVRHYFDGVFCCSEVGASKDRPDVFLRAMEFIGTNREETWVFEDSLTAVKTAKSAGFNVVGIYDELAPGAAEIENYADVFIGKGESFLSIIPKV